MNQNDTSEERGTCNYLPLGLQCREESRTTATTSRHRRQGRTLGSKPSAYPQLEVSYTDQRRAAFPPVQAHKRARSLKNSPAVHVIREEPLTDSPVSENEGRDLA